MTGVIHKLRSYVLFIALFFWTKTFSVCDPCKLLCGKELCCAVVEFKCNLTLGLLHCVCSLRLTSLVFCFQGRDDVENEDKGTWSLFCFLYLFNIVLDIIHELIGFQRVCTSCKQENAWICMKSATVGVFWQILCLRCAKTAESVVFLIYNHLTGTTWLSRFLQLFIEAFFVTRKIFSNLWGILIVSVIFDSSVEFFNLMNLLIYTFISFCVIGRGVETFETTFDHCGVVGYCTT